MKHPLGSRHWWDETWNTTGGCQPLSPGCLNCYAARCAGTLQTATDIALYLGTTKKKQGRYMFKGHGHLTKLPPGHPGWNFPLSVKATNPPLLGAGMPLLVWAGDMSELFLPGRPRQVLDRTISRLAFPDHIIGLILTKLPGRMAAYFNAQSEITQQHYREKLWLGFSAEDQTWFDRRWPHMRQLAEAGWTIFVSIAPMIGPVTLPDDSLALINWVICSGEQGLRKHVRYMRPSWCRAVRDQCANAGVAFFMKQMSGKRPIPLDLRIFEFPQC
jgi:protein gp37